jgi:hypothetical protein
MVLEHLYHSDPSRGVPRRLEYGPTRGVPRRLEYGPLRVKIKNINAFFRMKQIAKFRAE